MGMIQIVWGLMESRYPGLLLGKKGNAPSITNVHTVGKYKYFDCELDDRTVGKEINDIAVWVRLPGRSNRM